MHETEQGTNIAAQERELQVGDGFTGEEVVVDVAHDHVAVTRWML